MTVKALASLRGALGVVVDEARTGRRLLDALDGLTMRQHSPVEVDPVDHRLVCRLDRQTWPCAAWDDASTRRAARRSAR